MSTQDIDTTIAEILTPLFMRHINPGENISRKDENLWDSLKHMEIIFSIESVFGIEFELEIAEAIADVASLKSTIMTYLAS